MSSPIREHLLHHHVKNLGLVKRDPFNERATNPVRVSLRNLPSQRQCAIQFTSDMLFP